MRRTGSIRIALLLVLLAGCQPPMLVSPYTPAGEPLLLPQDHASPAADVPPGPPAPDNWVASVADAPNVSTVATPEAPHRFISLAECLALALEQGRTGAWLDDAGGRHGVPGLTRQVNPSGVSDSIRVFAYDPAITATDIEQSQARFDTVWNSALVFNRIDQPNRILNPDPVEQLLTRNRLDTAEFRTGLLQPLESGGLAGIFLRESYEYNQFPPGSGIVNPAYRGTFGLSFEQPLLRGAGNEVNQVRDAHPGGVRDVIPPGGRAPAILLARVGHE